MLKRLEAQLAVLEAQGNLRRLPEIPPGMVNLSSNDYLGLAADAALRDEFFATLPPGVPMSSSSSRLLSGNTEACRALEALLAETHRAEAALVFNSGYHANTGILPALADARTLILADRLVHASLIDGIRLSSARHLRYRHNDLDHLERLLAEHAAAYETVIVVTESIFSMDGDRADLPALAALKRRYPNLMIYLDEAHGVGVRGERGLGCAEEAGVMDEIDFLIGTCGKALASEGAYVICRRIIRDYLINTVRPFIFTTALPPLNLLWTAFIIRRLPQFADRRTRLAALSKQFSTAIGSPSDTQIIPLLIGASAEASARAAAIRRHGFYVLPVRPPTVPEGTSRLRFSLTADLATETLDRLIAVIGKEVSHVS